MNGPHDLGGAQGFGLVGAESDQAPFHAEWERRVFAITLAMGASGRWTLDETRFARESIPPGRYLASSYYAIWFEALQRLLIAKGLVSEGEMAGGPRAPPLPDVPVLRAEAVAAALARGGPSERAPIDPGPRFALGEPVRTRVMNPLGHTRLPRYARGKRGIVLAQRGRHVYPDANAAGGGESPQWLYTVRFDAAELWGRDTSASSVCVDCWEPYLE